MNYKFVSYAQDFASFLIEKFGADAGKINQIILFGSVVRGEATKKSDVDLFVNCDERLEKKINSIKEKFYKSVRFEKYWKLLNVENEINCSVGNLDDWSDLQKSIIADGIVLFGKYKGKAKTENYYLFVIGSGEDRNRSLSVWRKLYGYAQKVGKKRYSSEGLIKECGGKKLARGVFIIPSASAKKVASFLRKSKFRFEMISFWKEV